jgi:hypothetical protein
MTDLTCPRRDQCQHGDAIRVDRDGRCRDCGHQLVHPVRDALHRAEMFAGWPEEPYVRETTPDLFDSLVRRAPSSRDL